MCLHPNLNLNFTTVFKLNRVLFLVLSTLIRNKHEVIFYFVFFVYLIEIKLKLRENVFIVIS